MSFLPPLPSLYTYEVGLGSVDITDLFHRAFRVGTQVTHGAKQERARLRAVVNFATNELHNNGDSRVQDIAARLKIAPVSQSSEQWPEWARRHREACSDLRVIVVKLVSDGRPKLLSTSVSSVGSRILKDKLISLRAAFFASGE